MSLLGDLSKIFFKDACWYRVLHLNAAANSDLQECGANVVSLSKAQVEGAVDPIIQNQAWYGGDGTHIYGYSLDGRIVGVACYWFGERYTTRNFWPLQQGEAKLVQLITSPEWRGRGIAKELIKCSAADMFANGFNDLYARVWHSNQPSLRAFEKSGWRYIAQIIEVTLVGTEKPWRLVFDKAPK